MTFIDWRLQMEFYCELREWVQTVLTKWREWGYVTCKINELDIIGSSVRNWEWRQRSQMWTWEQINELKTESKIVGNEGSVTQELDCNDFQCSNNHKYRKK